MNGLENQLRSILDSSADERRIHRFLKKHPQLIEAVFNCAWNWHRCIPEFRLGADYRADFLILSAHSCAWNAIFVELKAPDAQLYLADGRPTRALGAAQKQIDEWRAWFRSNNSCARKQFAKILKEHDAPAHCSIADRFANGADEICHPEVVVHDHYHIVIGRSSMLSPKEQEYRALNEMFRPFIATYDRFLAIARRHDDANQASMI